MRGLLLLILAARVEAQQALSPADVEARGAGIFAQSANTGMVLVVVRNREVRMTSYGETSPGSGQPPGPYSLIRLCSISKVFAGELLTQLAGEGKLAPGDPLQRFAPPGAIVPQGADGTPITLSELATHTSGLPREVSAYPAKMAHFIFPDWKYRWAWLPKQSLLYRPGTSAVYSNIGFDLLGDALAIAANRSYSELLNDRIVRPLGLHDTTLSPTAEQCGQLLLGADQGPCTDTQASGASGGVYSTAADMARVLQFLLQRPIEAGLKPEQLRSVQGLSHAGDPTGIGLGWVQLGDPEGPSTVMQKTGGGAGFLTYIALSLKRQTGVFVAVTQGRGHGQVNLFEEANSLLTDLAGVPRLPARAPHPVRTKKKGALVRRVPSKGR